MEWPSVSRGSWKSQKRRARAHTRQVKRCNWTRIILRSFHIWLDTRRATRHTVVRTAHIHYVRAAVWWVCVFVFGIFFETTTLNELTIFSRFLWQLLFGIMLLFINAHDARPPTPCPLSMFARSLRFAMRACKLTTTRHSLTQTKGRQKKQTIILFSSLSCRSRTPLVDKKWANKSEKFQRNIPRSYILCLESCSAR